MIEYGSQSQSSPPSIFFIGNLSFVLLIDPTSLPLVGIPIYSFRSALGIRYLAHNLLFACLFAWLSGTKDKELWKAVEAIVIKAGEEWGEHAQASYIAHIVKFASSVSRVPLMS